MPTGIHFLGLEMEDQLSSPASSSRRKDQLPQVPIREVTPVAKARSMIQMNGLSSGENTSTSATATTGTSHSDPTRVHSPPADVDYCYGDAVPDSETRRISSPSRDVDVYGYESGSPDVAKKYSPDTAGLYGYESGSPDVARSSKVVSDNTDHYRIATAINYQYDGTRVPRRSSLKACSSYGGEPLSSQSCHGGVVRRRAPRRNSAIEVRIRGERNPVQRSRSIDFAEKVQVKEVKPVREMTDDIRDLWLQADDFAEMKERRRSLLEQYKRQQRRVSADMLSSSSSNNIMAPTLASIHHTNERNHEDSFRGLERYIDKSGRRQKNAAWDTVLLEQDEQECSGNFDENRIAELYKFSTQESPEKAFARAQQDREAIREYLTSPRTTKLMAYSKFRVSRRVSC